MSPARHARLALAGFVLALVASLVMVPGAIGASPCATKVLSDWYDNGRIDDRYPLDCYDEAIAAVPSEIRDYTNAQEVIARALDDAARQLGVVKNSAKSRTPSVVKHPTTRAPTVDTSAPSSVPVPLIVLASLSLVLLASGAFGYVVRRQREAGPE